MRFILLWLLAISCQTNQVLISYVEDGDTYVTEAGEHIRLADVDCPELKQSFGLEAKNYASSLITGNKVTIYRIGRDKYGRTIAQISIRGSNLADLLVSGGLAWVYRKYGSNELYLRQQTARKLKRGLWKYPNQIPPFKFRANDKSR